ncbi:DUF7668 domain-containing protein [Pseudomonas sp. HK3]
MRESHLGKVGILVLKDEKNEQPIPSVWRSTICSIINSFVRTDYSLSIDIAGVLPIPCETAVFIKEYIDDYGEALIDLPDEAWGSSICLWMDGYWDVLIDLWTEGEGRSDLVLSLQVFEVEGGYSVEIGMVYVP